MSWEKRPNKNNGGGSSVTGSGTNGKIKVDGQDVTVYDDSALKQNSHSHSNKGTLDKFGESSGKPTFNGSVIGTDSGGGGDSVYDIVTRPPLMEEFDEKVYLKGNNSLNFLMDTGQSLQPVFTTAVNIEFDFFVGGKSGNLNLLVGGDKDTQLVIALRGNQTIYDIVDQKGAGYIQTIKYTALTADRLTSGNGDRLKLIKDNNGVKLQLNKSGTSTFVDYIVLDNTYLGQFQSYQNGKSLGFMADRIENTWGVPLDGFMARNVLFTDVRETLYSKVMGNEMDITYIKQVDKKHMYNSTPSPIYIPDFSKTNQPYHPSVMYIPNGWNGYKYWMANTPYPLGLPPSRDRWECIHIYCSNDGIYWQVPTGFTNPIEDLTSGEIENQDFFSDPHLVLKDNKLEVFYRITHKNWTGTGNPLPTYILRRISADGITWSPRETLIDLEYGNSPIGKMVRSHSLYWDGTKYRIWFLYDRIPGVTTGGYYEFGYSESVDAITWTDRVKCNIDVYINPWHMDLLQVDGVYHLLSYTRVGQRLIYYRSTDGINFTYIKTLLQANGDKDSFYGTGLYRASLVYTGTKWKAYFTGENGIHAKNGLMIGDSVEELEVVNGNYHLSKQVFDKGIEIVNNGKLSSVITLADTGECFGFDYTTKEPYFQKADGTKIYFTR